MLIGKVGLTPRSEEHNQSGIVSDRVRVVLRDTEKAKKKENSRMVCCLVDSSVFLSIESK